MKPRPLAAVWLAGLILLVAGCGHPISRELRRAAKGSPPFPAVLVNPAAHVGAIVIWGGEIIATSNHKDGTDLTVLETPLSGEGEPGAAIASRGRFIAKSPQFLDPAIFRTGERITVAGQVVGSETKPLGGIQYAYPVLSVREFYLWEREPIVYYRYYYPPPGWWGPPFGGWGWGWGWYGTCD